MANELTAELIREGSKLAGSFLRSLILKSSSPVTTQTKTIESEHKQVETSDSNNTKQDKPKDIHPTINAAMLSGGDQKLYNPSVVDDEDYRWECLTKHLGAAAVLFREAHERAVTDNKVTDGVAEKIMAALSEHAGADDDLKPMLSNPKSKPEAEKMMNALRQLRRAAWDCRITVGGGTIDDVSDARLWNDMLFQTAYANAKKHAGSECVMSGM
ncbi:MAG: hypothetical protein WCY09_09320 [Candidatus Omnitrophota bacterium]